MHERIAGLLVWLAAFAVFVVALLLPATDFTGNETVYYGYDYFMCGFWGCANSPKPVWGWYANPLFMMTLPFLLLRLSWVAVVIASIGLAVAFFTSMGVTEGLSPNEGGVVTHHFVAWRAGFYVWLASFAVLMVGSAGHGIALRLRKPRLNA